MAKKIIKDLVKHGKVIRPWLGVVGENIVTDEDKAFGTSNIYGVIVQNLVVEGPAQKSGLRIGDLILELSGQKVSDLHTLQRILTNKTPSEMVTLKLYRRNKGFMNLTVGLEVIPDSRNLPTDEDLL